MKNYICIDGKKAELTPEQLKALGIEVKKKNPFDRGKRSNVYYYILETGIVGWYREVNDSCDSKMFDVANYCTDKALMEQRAFHETLYRLLWRYSMEHDGDKIEWSDKSKYKYKLVFDYEDNKVVIDFNRVWGDIGVTCFYTREIAENAIKEIIEPFMKEHPEFKW